MQLNNWCIGVYCTSTVGIKKTSRFSSVSFYMYIPSVLSFHRNSVLRANCFNYYRLGVNLSEKFTERVCEKHNVMS